MQTIVLYATLYQTEMATKFLLEIA